MSKKRKHPKTNWYVVGAVLPIAFLPVVIFIPQNSRLGSFVPVIALIVLSVIGMTCCVQGFRKSSNAWIQMVSILFGLFYLFPLWVLGFILSGPMQK